MSPTLRPCSIGGLASPSGHLLASCPPRSNTLSLPPARGLGGRSNLKLANPTMRRGHGIVNGAADGRQVDGHQEDPAEMDYELRGVKDRIGEFCNKISNAGILYKETTEFRRHLCTVAEDSVKMVSIIMGKPIGTMPQDALLTTLMTPTKRENLVLQVHLRTFVSTAEAAYHDKVTKETIVSFLGALDGVAAMSYFMARDTLAKFSDDETISPNCGQNINIDITRRRHTVKMDTLKHELCTAPADISMKILWGTVNKMVLETWFFVNSMTACRRKVLRGLTQGTQGRQKLDDKPFSGFTELDVEKFFLGQSMW